MRLIVFDYFRAIAILSIVAGHCISYKSITSFDERVIANLIQGGSPLFVFISGFFFHHIFYRQFQYSQFMLKKVKNVLLPYVFLSLLALIYYLSSGISLPDAKELGITSLANWQDYLSMIGLYLWTGRTSFAYWYIPFIMLIFLMSPLFISYIRQGVRIRLLIFIIALVLAMIVHRPAGNLSPWHAVMYFLPMYLLGILVSMHREPVQRYLHNKAFILGVTVVFLAILQALIYLGFGNLHKLHPFTFDGLDILILQKIVLCFFFLSLLEKLSEHYPQIPLLRLLADASFAIYFIHPWVLIALVEYKWLPNVENMSGLHQFIITFPLTILISMTLAYVIKRCAGQYSRSLTGW
ncbi:acyltransferase family protein [Methylophaga sulfidovorans]|uniref:Peptidoglycan/LPS O-acetylase OafA/YrhL, contains acyltransferase and SGNH-hydrolase domains n=1 Tax=Methylophaga sulfidovorans TaxID=45496 RepID=A0A1I3V3I2_9GAMM|nr:acyltransferase [Methylophaga sulfidovorans]SFJ89795.1 Peptidoglycan/LPS O-acetylase OafA/YrhL, contains acyltransferase and SGNH-hydrolase domains [Methylophaga sulfidovorans]